MQDLASKQVTTKYPLVVKSYAICIIEGEAPAEPLALSHALF